MSSSNKYEWGLYNGNGSCLHFQKASFRNGVLVELVNFFPSSSQKMSRNEIERAAGEISSDPSSLKIKHRRFDPSSQDPFPSGIKKRANYDSFIAPPDFTSKNKYFTGRHSGRTVGGSTIRTENSLATEAESGGRADHYLALYSYTGPPSIERINQHLGIQDHFYREIAGRALRDTKDPKKDIFDTPERHCAKVKPKKLDRERFEEFRQKNKNYRNKSYLSVENRKEAFVAFRTLTEQNYCVGLGVGGGVSAYDFTQIDIILDPNSGSFNWINMSKRRKQKQKKKKDESNSKLQKLKDSIF